MYIYIYIHTYIHTYICIITGVGVRAVRPEPAGGRDPDAEVYDEQ